jgi:hypothetical protein
MFPLYAKCDFFSQKVEKYGVASYRPPTPENFETKRTTAAETFLHQNVDKKYGSNFIRFPSSHFHREKKLKSFFFSASHHN